MESKKQLCCIGKCIFASLCTGGNGERRARSEPGPTETFPETPCIDHRGGLFQPGSGCQELSLFPVVKSHRSKSCVAWSSCGCAREVQRNRVVLVLGKYCMTKSPCPQRLQVIAGRANNGRTNTCQPSKQGDTI